MNWISPNFSNPNKNRILKRFECFEGDGESSSYTADDTEGESEAYTVDEEAEDEDY